jgi:hypothetical protein
LRHSGGRHRLLHTRQCHIHALTRSAIALLRR